MKKLSMNKFGHEYLGLCPFHKEKTPSFTMKDDKYHCFGCGEQGSVEDLQKTHEITLLPEIPLSEEMQELIDTCAAAFEKAGFARTKVNETTYH